MEDERLKRSSPVNFSFQTAHDAICSRAAELASSASAEELVKISDAVQKVAYGPQGGDTEYAYNYTADITNRHDDRRSNGRMGFSE
jgi:hypothetical protein